ncbi:MAG: hypothetical protein VKL42_08835 [Snowella sp.]|nr:hypothetical protein [Snowella sp.]
MRQNGWNMTGERVRAWLYGESQFGFIKMLDEAYDTCNPELLDQFKRDLINCLNKNDMEAMYWKEKIEELEVKAEVQLSINLVNPP